MVSVASDHAFEKVDMLLVYACEAVLFDDEDSQTVTCIEKFRSHRIMAGTVCVASEFLQLQKPPLLKSVGYSASYTCMILVHVHTLELHLLSVEDEAFVRVEPDMPYSCHGFICVGECAVCKDLCNNRI